MATNDWGIGVIGLGSIAQQHIEAYRQRGFRVVGGGDVDPQRIETVAKRFGLAFATTDYRKLLACDEVRMVDVVIPHVPGVRAHPREEVFIQGSGGTLSGDSENLCVYTTSPVPARLYPRINGRWFPDAMGRAKVNAASVPHCCGSQPSSDS